MQWIAVSLMMVLSFNSFATVTVGSCPEEFEGRVKAKVEELGPGKGLGCEKVVFENLHTLKGEVEDQVQIDMLKGGPFEVEAGKDYRVQLRNGRLCWIEAI